MADVGVLASPTEMTRRLEMRLPVESDRERFVQLFCDERFIAFSAAVLDVDSRTVASTGCWSELRSCHSRSSPSPRRTGSSSATRA